MRSVACTVEISVGFIVPFSLQHRISTKSERRIVRSLHTIAAVRLFYVLSFAALLTIYSLDIHRYPSRSASLTAAQSHFYRLCCLKVVEGVAVNQWSDWFMLYYAE